MTEYKATLLICSQACLVEMETDLCTDFKAGIDQFTQFQHQTTLPIVCQNLENYLKERGSTTEAELVATDSSITGADFLPNPNKTDALGSLPGFGDGTLPGFPGFEAPSLDDDSVDGSDPWAWTGNPSPTAAPTAAPDNGEDDDPYGLNAGGGGGGVRESNANKGENIDDDDNDDTDLDDWIDKLNENRAMSDRMLSASCLFMMTSLTAMLLV